MSLVVILRNTSNLKDVSNYDYWVRIGDGTPEGSAEIAGGTVEGHRRIDGWKALVQRVLDEDGTSFAP